MKFTLLIFLSLFILSGHNSFPQEINNLKAEADTEAKAIVKDAIVFKVREKTYLFSQMQSFKKQMNNFVCLFPNPNLFRDFNWTKWKDYKLMPLENLENIVNPQKEMFEKRTIAFFNDFKSILRLIHYLQTSTDLDKKLRVDIVQEGKRHGCFKKDIEDLHPLLQKMIVVESSLRARFNLDSFWVADSEVEKVRGDYPNKSFQEIKIILQKDKKQKAMKSLWSSVAEQVEIRTFYE